MTIVAIDIQPQYRFSCMAVNDRRFLHQPEKIVDPLNQQARFADKRLLVENTAVGENNFCRACIEAPLNRSGLVFRREEHDCRRTHLLNGLPCPADYDHTIEVIGSVSYGACFHDKYERHGSGLIEWLAQSRAETVIIGGLATEDAVAKTAKQLAWHRNDLQIIVNLQACCGYTPESTIQAIYNMRELGIAVAADEGDLPELLNRFSSQTLFKVS